MIDIDEDTIEEIKIGELIWAKIDGYPWWPSIILNVKEEKAKQPTQWTVSFLGEKESYQHLVRNRIKKWSELSTNKTKTKQFKTRKSYMSAVAFANYIQANELTYANHAQYIKQLESKAILQGEEGVKQFKEHLLDYVEEEDEGKNGNKANDKDKDKDKVTYQSDIDAINAEVEVIKKNMNIIISKLPSDQLIKQFSHVDLNNTDTLCDSFSIDTKMALLNYLEFLCQMYQIPYETNQALEELVQKLNNATKE